MCKLIPKMQHNTTRQSK